VNPLISAPTTGMGLMLATFVAAAVLFTWLTIRYGPALGIAGALIFFPLLPTLAAVRVYDQGDMTHDRYLYLPSVGLCLLVGVVGGKLWPGSRFAMISLAGASAVIAIVFVYLTVTQQKFYKNDEAFYQRGIDVAPTNALATYLLGETYLGGGQPDRAMALFQTAHQLEPNNPITAFHLARGLFETHQYAEAEPLLAESAHVPALRANQKPLLLALANAKMNLGKPAEAEQVLRQLEGIDPTYRGLHRTLGILFQRERRLPEAQAEYTKEFRISGDVESGRQAAALEEFLGHASH
jgi:tetratricopeptide (TPR) repeat protein